MGRTQKNLGAFWTLQRRSVIREVSASSSKIHPKLSSSNRMSVNFKPFNLVCLVIFVFQALLPDSTDSKSISRKRECLKNCHICKGFYGDNFMGHLCAQTCVKLDGQIMPNCNELIS